MGPRRPVQYLWPELVGTEETFPMTPYPSQPPQTQEQSSIEMRKVGVRRPLRLHTIDETNKQTDIAERWANTTTKLLMKETEGGFFPVSFQRFVVFSVAYKRASAS